MPKLPHEALVQLVRQAPDLIPRLLGRGPAGAAALRVGPAEFVDLHFAEYRADLVLVRGEPPEEAFIVEAQQEPDPRKRRTWPFYGAGLHVRLACAVYLVVLALDPDVARWAAAPIDLGGGRFVLHPLVLGPDAIPVITDPDLACADPELAVLSVAAHAHEPGAERIAFAALAAALPLDDDRGVLYPDFITALLPQVARAALETLMQSSTRYEFQSDFARRYFASGKADLVLKLLQLRGLTPSDAQRERLLGCSDAARLDAWAARILTARTADEVFADD